MRNGKNESIVEFPIEGLELFNYVLGESDKEFVYDLFAISKHSGNIKNNHYTSLCKNNGKWYEFDDEDVYKIYENHPFKTYCDAYLLFYKMRK